MRRRMIRQGDVLIWEEQAPAGATVVPPEADRVVLAEGEATGHAHAVAAADAELLVVSDQADRWLRVRSRAATPVRHAEHDVLTRGPGEHRVRRQREYRNYAVRRVAD